MPNIWVCKSNNGDGPGVGDAYQNLIKKGIGGFNLAEYDPTKFKTLEELNKRINKDLGNWQPGHVTGRSFGKQFWDIGHSVQLGDWFFLECPSAAPKKRDPELEKGKRGPQRTFIVAAGIVTGPYAYKPTTSCTHQMKVDWQWTGMELIDYPFQMMTFVNIDSSRPELLATLKSIWTPGKGIVCIENHTKLPDIFAKSASECDSQDEDIEISTIVLRQQHAIEQSPTAENSSILKESYQSDSMLKNSVSNLLVDSFESIRLTKNYESFCEKNQCDVLLVNPSNTLESLQKVAQTLLELTKIDQTIKKSESELLNEESSEYLYGPLIPLLYNAHTRSLLTEYEWLNWISHARAGKSIDVGVKSLCADILCNCPSEAEGLSLRDLLDATSSTDLKGLPTQNIPNDLIIMCTAWAAYKNKYQENTLESYLSKLPCIINEVEGILELREGNDDNELAAGWQIWTLMVSLRGELDRKIGEVSAAIKDNWPSNRLNETFRDYLVADRLQLLKRKNFGKKKLRTVTRCFAYAAIHGRSKVDEEIVAPHSLVKSLNLPALFLKCIELRYGDSGVQTLDACGRKMGLTRERIRQMEEKVFEKVRILCLSEGVQKWVTSQAEKIWDDISNGGALIRRDSFTESGYLRDKPELALGLAMTNLTISEILDLKGAKTEIGNWVYRD